MLAHAKDEGIVDDQSCALRLRDIKIMALSVRGGVACQESIGWVLSCMQQWYGEGESMRVVLDRVHEPALACVYFQNTFAFIAGEECFHSVTLSAANPGWLGKSDLASHVAGFKKVTIHVAGEGAGFDFSNYLHVFGDCELDMCHLQILEVGY
jgi:hypothetical protein